MFLSVVVPAYNEEKRLSRTLFAIDAYLKSQSYEYEIIVVDDGSTDCTLEITKNLYSKIANLKLLSNKENHGKGYVVRQGLLAAKGDWRLFVDADNSTSIDQLEKFLPFIKTYDIIIGSRAIAGAVLSPPQPFFRSAAGAVVKLLIRFIVAISEIQDTQCGFKLFSKKAVESIFTKCTISGWVFDAEILKIAKNMGYATKEVPVVWQNDAASKVRLISIGGILRDLVKIRHNAIMVKYHE